MSARAAPVNGGLFADALAGAPEVRFGYRSVASPAGGNTTFDVPEGTVLDSTGQVVAGLNLSLFTGSGAFFLLQQP